MAKPRIMFLWPGVYLGWESLGQGFEKSSMNHGLASISAVLKQAGYDCFMFDLRALKNWQDYEETMKRMVFDICFIGFLSVDNFIADQAIRIIKTIFPGKPVVAGGVHITFNQLKSFSVADTVVWGEGDEVCLDLVHKFERGESFPAHIIAPVIKNLDTLPFVDRGLFHGGRYEPDNPFLPLLEKPFFTINFSRGCNFSCKFCLESKNLLWKGQRVRSPEHCVEELVQMRKGGAIGPASLMIHDDNFPPKRSWIEGFIEAWTRYLPRIPWWCQMRADFICKNEDLISELSDCGMTWCSLGIEGSQRMLDFYNKKLTVEQVIKAGEILHKNNINIFGNYIMGSPTETHQDIDDLGRVLDQIRPVHHSSSTYTAYPGSILFDYCRDNNLFVGDGKSDADYYSLVRYPYERKIVGIDYDYVRSKQSEFASRYAGVLRKYVAKPMSRKLPPPKPIALAAAPILLPFAKVTIVLLSHNRPTFLSEAINSIMAQNMGDWELIIIDDCSTDPGVLPVLEQASKDKRIKVFRANYDVDNISLLWNRALDIATGEYIALLDDDNKKKPTFCSEMSGFLDAHPEFDAVACFNELYQWEGSRRLDREHIFAEPAEATKENILEGNKIDSGCMMFRRSVIEKIGWFDERLTTEDDWDYVIRIMHETKGFGIIPKPLAEYRWHGDNRIYRSQELGIATTHAFITQEKRHKYGKPLSLLLFHPDQGGITLSQNNVLRGVTNALKSIPWITFESCPAGAITPNNGFDVVIAFMPFALSNEQMIIARSKGYKLITYQIEDPPALGINLERVRQVDYVFTNDISTVSDYEKIVGNGFVGYCPSISFDDIGLPTRPDAPKRYEVIFYGYAYDSRVKFVKELISKTRPGLVTVVGGGWADKGISAPQISELSEMDSLQVMEEAKIVVLYNRLHTDCGGKDSSSRHESVVRGYFECASGSLIMLDSGRGHHNLDGVVAFYSNVDDLVKKIKFYLSNDEERQAIGRRARQRAFKDFTYKKRITDLVNAVRSMRYSYEVK